MADQPHRIGRFEFMASVADDDTARAMRPRIEALVRDLVPALLERVFDAAVPAGCHVRLDRIDLDLGNVRADQLEADILAGLERALGDTLARAISPA
ncbi:MAG: contractile injection system tape measure protein [Pseudomonadota bacterium]|uniref:contractile injection system tape measure protein n=1 Tax=Sphingomonas sp. ERG5 TaxID=1381597 RepID=UPI00054C05F8|nr:contractile injection system tape measure protein [Sphingomonas sp. ERG5]